MLCSFDKEYAGFVAQNSPTGEFINVVIARTDKRTRAFEGTLVGTLRSVSTWDRGEVVWVRGADGEGEEGRSLGDAVKRLERHRQGLERYGNKFKFAAMAEKIEMLCEGISYLLFQQLVGG